VSAMLLQVATPVLVDDGGRRRNRGSSFTDSGFLVRLNQPVSGSR
jgi:hypothetical protein